MIKQILGTLGTKVVVTLITFGIVVLNTRVLGTEGQGSIALINLGIAIALAINNYIGGGAVVYLAPRINPIALLLPSYVWSIIVAILVWLTLDFANFFPQGYAAHIAAITFLHSIFLFNAQLLLGKMKIHSYNALMLIQVGLVLLTLVWFFWVENAEELFSYIIALYISFSVVCAMSFALTIPYLKSSSTDLKKGFKELWRFGKFNQTAYLSHVLNKRLSYYFLDNFKWIGRSGVGVYSIGTQLVEAVWLASSSLATVQYSHISNSKDQSSNVALTLILMKVSFLLAFCGMAVLLLLPESIYIWVFKEGISGVKSVMLFLAPGVVAMSCNAILTHHFSGTGRHKVGMNASLVALALMILLNLILIPTMGMSGAAIATSVAFIAQTLYHVFIFQREEGVRFRDFLIDRNDLKRSKDILIKLILSVKAQ